MKIPEIILASTSPRRHEILKDFDIPFIAIAPDVEEVTLDDPIETARQNALLKAEIVFKQNPERIVLASDTVVAVDNQVLGKPIDEKDAYRILKLISGKTQQVISSFCILGPKIKVLDQDTTTVNMREMSDEEITNYIKSGEPFGKAGAYAIQENGDKFVTSIQGSFFNVVGLPIEKIMAAFMQLYDQENERYYF